MMTRLNPLFRFLILFALILSGSLPGSYKISAAADVEYDNFSYLPMLGKGDCQNFTGPFIKPWPQDFPFSALAGRINSPADCATGLAVNTPFLVSGTVQDAMDAHLWVFVYPPNMRYYPQCNYAAVGDCGVLRSGDTWSVSTYLWLEPKKEGFHILLVEVNAAGDQFLINSMKRWAGERYFPGLTAGELAGCDVKVLSKIAVETRAK